MSEVQTFRVFVEGPNGEQFEVNIPHGTRISEVAADFAEAQGWPSQHHRGRGQGVVVELVNPENPEETKRLNSDLGLYEAGIREGDTLRIFPESRGGGPGDFIVITASVATVVQVILMAVDMWWGRKRKGKKNTHSGTNDRLEMIQTSMPRIRVLMSDGSWVPFPEWYKEPEKLKSFIGLFGSPTASPRPLLVIFEGVGPRLQLVLSNDVESRERLDETIEWYLQFFSD